VDHGREPLFAPTISLSETHVGAARVRGPDGLAAVRADLDWLEAIDVSEPAVAEAARVDEELRGEGTPIGAMDTLIAGIVRERGGTVVTADDHFERVDGLEVHRYVRD